MVVHNTMTMAVIIHSLQKGAAIDKKIHAGSHAYAYKARPY